MPLNISLREDEGGVSELVGTILTLSITVVLFTSVFAAVNNLEQPEEREHAELDATFERSENKAYVNITHQSGESLQMEQLTFALFVDGVVYRYDEDDVVLDGDDPWSPGEKVMIEESHSDVLSSSNIDIVVRNDENGRVVYDSTLVDLEEEPLSIERMDIKFVYDWRDYAEPGEEIDIRADISVSEELDENDLEVRADIPGKDIFEEEEPVTLERLRGNLFNKTVTIQSGAEVRRHSLRIIAELGSEKAEEYTNLNIGEETVDIYQPDLVVGDIDFSPGSPTHGDEFTVIGNIYNYGRVNYTAEWEIKDDGEVKKEGVTTFAPGPAPTRIRGNFDLEDHGAHDIEVNVSTTLHLEEDMSGETEEDVKPEDNVRELTVHVDPHIALVRDSLGDELREGRLMENALRGLNLDYRVRTIRSEDDIPDDADEFRKELNESSVIIWMTGNRTEDETEDDVIHIGNDVVKEAVHDFIVDDEGEFWLIGSNLDEADYSPHLYPKLGFKGFETNNKGLGSETVLEPGGDNGTYGDYNYTVKPGEDYLPMNVKDDAEDNNTLINPGPNDIYGVGYEENEGERTAVNSFLFENVMDSGQRMNMVSEVIEWLTSMTTRTGVDVAVSSQDIEPEAPMYMDEVTITATLRNNGPEDLYVNVRCVRNKGEEVLSPEEGEAIYVPKNGGTNTTTFKWMAEDLGVQEFIVHADYFDEIDEVNEENNQITYKDLEVTDDVVEINVHYSTLVVDADLSESSAYDHNATADVIDSFEQLDHKKGRDYDYYQVGMSGSDPEDGPDYDTMSEYNAVFWITGERESRVLTSADMDNLEQYVEQDSGANVMFIGEHILEDLSGNDFLEDMMGIDPDSIGEEESSELIGQEDNNLSHGLEYELDGSAELDTFDTSGAEVLFEDGEGNNLASIYDDGLKKVVYMGANLSRVSGPLVDEEKYEDWPEGEVDLGHENARDEFVYTTMWQLGKRDERTELRVIDHDIEFTTGEPHTGRSYEIRADIQNLGYGGASALIRIKDGGDYIGAESIFIEGSERISEEGSTYFEVEPGTATLEITWRPNHGGYRDIRVRVDPLRRTKEIAEDGESREDKLMEFHNQASVKQPVYFFHDDMEEGTEDWDNERMLMNIDGTGPLDFIDREDAQTDVVGEWDESLSGSTDGSDVYTLDQDTDDAGVYETDDEEVEAFTDKAHYSSPRSFWMPEVEGVDERKPIDLVIVLDYSGSMDDEEGDMEDAATAAVGMLSDQDRVAVFPFAYDPWTDEEIHFTYCTQSNKDTINQTIRSWSTGGNTALYDTTARAGEYMQNNARDDVVKGFIGMTDGYSNSDEADYTHAPGTSTSKDTYGYKNDWESSSLDWYDYSPPYSSDSFPHSQDSGRKGCLGMP
ncbi:MAG: CARDB domain-containing protein, partial [Candidatus Aenigmatarchaeota archaeon]